jgi:pyrroloquinoline quinone biosynthesis protein B
VRLGARLAVTPVIVPHRDDVSETIGFRIDGPERRVLYVPDIDQWSEWSVPLEQILLGVDIAYLDGTFYQAGEVHGRDLAAIPHPPIADTMALLAPLPATLRARVRFIHLNHTNPALDPEGAAARAVAEGGFALAVEGERVTL